MFNQYENFTKSNDNIGFSPGEGRKGSPIHPHPPRIMPMPRPPHNNPPKPVPPHHHVPPPHKPPHNAPPPKPIPPPHHVPPPKPIPPPHKPPHHVPPPKPIPPPHMPLPQPVPPIAPYPINVPGVIMPVSGSPQQPVLPPPTPFTDYGPAPFVVNIEQATLENDYYRQTLWSGTHLQSTLMCIPVGGEIGLELHPDNDQFLRLEEGQGLVQMGHSENNLTHRQTVFANSAVFVPAGTWHNITNIGNSPMKLYAIYAPPHHPHGTVHTSKAAADAMGD